ncbi:phage minor head protein [Rhizobium azibense]|uniref:Phage Mu protein F like protein n=1 Tax=Rhizobium azibense TaxID=1136135 RepID=A0A4R3RJS5_9HYPH|nr:phage minor head protein [Rhizobium azibense]TCU35441.1 phage Mu protein F like protein [Rhizobium azibense]
MAEIRKGFTAPKEVTRYFDGKTLKPAFSWLDVWGEEHAYAFTVAKATEAEVLSAFHQTIGEAIRSGKGFERWKEDVQAELRKLGWWGPRMVGDPTEEHPDRLVDFSSSRRLKTIFWSNINSARAAGQWERAQRSKRVLPYMLYVRTTSSDPRPEHLAFVGVILPVDDPFWRTHWPPNGWGCKCQVRQISAKEAESLLGRKPADGGIIYRNSPPDLGPDIQHRNRRTGELTLVPPGIDPGWQTNAGLARATTLIQNLEERLATAPAAKATEILTELWSDPYLQLAPRLEPKVWLPAGLSVRIAEDLGAKSPIISITGEAIADRMKRHRMSIGDFALLPVIVDHAVSMPDRRGNRQARTLYCKIGAIFWRAFVSVSETGYLRLNSLHKKNEKEVRREFARLGQTLPFH